MALLQKLQDCYVEMADAQSNLGAVSSRGADAAQRSSKTLNAAEEKLQQLRANLADMREKVVQVRPR